MMLLLIAAAAAASPAPLTVSEQRFDACITLIDTDPAKAIDAAGAWRIEGGGVPARQCLGLAYAALGRWAAAATAFEQAAQEAEKQRDGRATNLWVQTGNAALAATDAAKARTAFDAALASGVLTGLEAGEVHLDRARALVALKDVSAARKDIDEAIKLAPADPLGWLLSATLARRAGDLTRAQADIAEALNRAPDDASVALEAGNIAMASGSADAAKTAWEAAVKLAPESVSGKSATKALDQFKAAPAP
ncbi:MAG: tetratricopeptide repeat protein [Chakrabartia sp.]